MIRELEYLEFSDEELEKFFSKFSYRNFDIINTILYFSSLSHNLDELVLRLTIAKENALNKCNKDNDLRIEQEMILLSKKELELLSGLLDEAQLCASSDNRYTREAIYLDYLKFNADKEFNRKLHAKRKKLGI